MLMMIVAVDNNNLIGKNGQLPWHLPRDLAYFKAITLHHPVVMGFNTWQGLGRALPQRENWLLTHQQVAALGITVVQKEFVLAQAKVQDIFIIGGASLYHQFWQAAQRLYLTRIDGSFTGDVWLQEPMDSWQLTQQSYHQKDAENAYNCTFEVYTKRHK